MSASADVSPITITLPWGPKWTVSADKAEKPSVTGDSLQTFVFIQNPASTLSQSQIAYKLIGTEGVFLGNTLDGHVHVVETTADGFNRLSKQDFAFAVTAIPPKMKLPLEYYESESKSESKSESASSSTSSSSAVVTKTAVSIPGYVQPPPSKQRAHVIAYTAKRLEKPVRTGANSNRAIYDALEASLAGLGGSPPKAVLHPLSLSDEQTALGEFHVAIDDSKDLLTVMNMVASHPLILRVTVEEAASPAASDSKPSASRASAFPSAFPSAIPCAPSADEAC
jgi:hypothetical protein